MENYKHGQKIKFVVEGKIIYIGTVDFYDVGVLVADCFNSSGKPVRIKIPYNNLKYIQPATIMETE